MFKKASKAQAKLRAAFFGPSGSGKTFTALRVATGIGGKIAVIDSERGSASKYADRFEFDACDLDGKTIDDYCNAITEAGKGGYNVLIIDSLSHAWQELIEEVDRLAKVKFKGNTWSAWSEGTPQQRSLVNAILSFPGHIIATMRSKTEWTTEKGDNGKSAPRRVGLAPEQGKGIEYEFDILVEITSEHYATIIKDRSGKFQDRIIEKPDEEFGKELAAWLSDGVRVISPVETLARLIVEKATEVVVNDYLRSLAWIEADQTFTDLSPERIKTILAKADGFFAKALAHANPPPQPQPAPAAQ